VVLVSVEVHVVVVVSWEAGNDQPVGAAVSGVMKWGYCGVPAAAEDPLPGAAAAVLAAADTSNTAVGFGSRLWAG
jgi:hypothetical protein